MKGCVMLKAKEVQFLDERGAYVKFISCLPKPNIEQRESGNIGIIVKWRHSYKEKYKYLLTLKL